MSACESQLSIATDGVAAALRAVDCLAHETTSSAFDRLFGGNGALMPVLTVLLTLYIGFFAISLLTGRSRLGISALTPRMMTLGLVLTFATSSVAYQSVVWNLAVGGPDQIAGVLMGTQGSATQLFGDRIDIVFNAIAETAAAANGGQSAAGAAASAGSFTPTNLMWLSAIMLLLGTVGVLVTARIAMAVLLALGPIFIVFALFPGTIGLFAGWLRGVVLTAIAPVFAVLGGGFILELIVPVLAGLRSVEGIDGRAAIALFLIAAIHIALMIMVLRVAGTMVANWQVFGLTARDRESGSRSSVEAAMSAPSWPVAAPQQATNAMSSRRAAVTMPVAVSAPTTLQGAAPSIAAQRSGRTSVIQPLSGAGSQVPLPRQRARGIGSRFRPLPNQSREMIR